MRHLCCLLWTGDSDHRYACKKITGKWAAADRGKRRSAGENGIVRTVESVVKKCRTFSWKQSVCYLSVDACHDCAFSAENRAPVWGPIFGLWEHGEQPCRITPGSLKTSFYSCPLVFYSRSGFRKKKPHGRYRSDFYAVWL